ncbi:hypothetical protein EVAR_74401_1 [Eumeta japonica]|uniref:Uncharacterized protein n=1 Tax=Eumeta variegata TaxID=151549 RepID=A0A4C1SG77_EUMVA|nr:hypothetical protein EVAR_74401_1 [Eumeta japonica]
MSRVEHHLNAPLVRRAKLSALLRRAVDIYQRQPIKGALPIADITAEPLNKRADNLATLHRCQGAAREGRRFVRRSARREVEKGLSSPRRINGAFWGEGRGGVRYREEPWEVRGLRRGGEGAQMICSV